MKVSELIESLKQCHPDCHVTVSMAVDSLPEDGRNEYFRIYGDVCHINDTGMGRREDITLIAAGEPNYPFKLIIAAYEKLKED